MHFLVDKFRKSIRVGHYPCLRFIPSFLSRLCLTKVGADFQLHLRAGTAAALKRTMRFLYFVSTSVSPSLLRRRAAQQYYTLGCIWGVSKIPYHRVVASELLRIANRKPTAHFRSLKHIVGNKVTNLKLHRSVLCHPFNANLMQKESF